MELDGYKYFRDNTPTRMGKRIELINFNNAINPVRSFHEYTGTLQEASPFRVRFAEGPLFHRVVTLDGATPRELSTQFIIVFNPLFYTYMWRYIDGDETETALDLSNVDGGKTKRKRKRRKTRRKRN